MATRDDIVRKALAEDGYHDGLGYDEINKYAEDFGIGYPIAYCDIFVAWVFAQCGVPLPDMHGIGVPLTSGAQYCPDSWAYAATRGATRNSYEAEPGDQAIFDWTGTGNLGPESHTELVQFYDKNTGWLYTIGGNSGPSNVDGFDGTGGVHRHAWYCPAGVGNSLIMGAINVAKLVTFTEDDFVLSPEDKKFFEAQFAKLAQKSDVSQIVSIFEDGAKHSFGMEGIKDLDAKLNKIAQHFGLPV